MNALAISPQHLTASPTTSTTPVQAGDDAAKEALLDKIDAAGNSVRELKVCTLPHFPVPVWNAHHRGCDAVRGEERGKKTQATHCVSYCPSSSVEH